MLVVGIFEMSDQAAPPSSSENIQVEEDGSLRATSKSRASRLRPAQADGPQTSSRKQFVFFIETSFV